MLLESSSSRLSPGRQLLQQLTVLLLHLLLLQSTYRSQYGGRSAQQTPLCIHLEAQACWKLQQQQPLLLLLMLPQPTQAAQQQEQQGTVVAAAAAAPLGPAAERSLLWFRIRHLASRVQQALGFRVLQLAVVGFRVLLSCLLGLPVGAGLCPLCLGLLTHQQQMLHRKVSVKAF
jgi:hypothetical protein